MLNSILFVSTCYNTKFSVTYVDLTKFALTKCIYLYMVYTHVHINIDLTILAKYGNRRNTYSIKGTKEIKKEGNL